ncbi:uncharacterized protein N7511_005783 [Penicillium nucicola]|uniref:uncharacterized protein n=1 Tax=Penicillium nucicola TaxID=1850975 RepID=UPI00254573FD|nr:uncharacterized protein N7511_005783 [Penicillium nucicola]KAJ5762401.1 hypothetical protein N7511_005783 [Penicillium nucicola]
MSISAAQTDDYPALSRPFESMKSEYDVVIIGSGYGAGVAASRMARAGKSVAVLELGWERRSGSFPQTFSQCVRDMNVSGSSAKNSFISTWLSAGDPTRLFQLFLGDGQHTFAAHGELGSSCSHLCSRYVLMESNHIGLGGTSLINCGVFLKADTGTLEMSPWPSQIRENPSGLDEYYSRAEEMLQPFTYPEKYSNPAKLEHLRNDSTWLGQGDNFYRAPVTTFFHGGRNKAGVPMHPNRRSGHECTGLNDGSKNTVATSYLADAWNWGAEMFCGCEVRFVEKMEGGGYIIFFTWHGHGRSVFADHFKEQLFWVKAREFCFLGAGALGTTEILLRSRQHCLQMSPLVGRNVSGNGDLLMFGYNGSADVNGIAGDSSQASIPPGPTVTCVVDNRNADARTNPLAGYVIQDGCIPETFTPVILPMLTMQTAKSQGLSFLRNPKLTLSKSMAAFRSLLFGPYARGGSLQRTSTYLVMSHDSNELALTLQNDRLRLRGSEGPSEHFTQMKRMIKELFSRTGADMGFSYFYGRHEEEVTVHLLGGANMSSDGTGQGGVTDHLGQVFTGPGDEVYNGLVCCDASIIPTALGVNPLATISALSERSVSLLAKKSGLTIDQTENGALDAASNPQRVHKDQNQQEIIEKKAQSIGWQFTETLSGHISMKSGFKNHAFSERIGRGSSCAMRMFITIDICHISSPGSSSRYQGICTGTVSCHALSRYTLKVVQGTVDFFVGEADTESTISYHMKLFSVEGLEYALEGHKLLNSGMSFSVKKTWQATTTVNVNISRLDGTQVGAGALHISLPDFTKQMRTFRTRSVDISSLLALLAFLFTFLYHVSIFFFMPFVPVRFPRTCSGDKTKKISNPPFTDKINASDGVPVLLEVYNPIQQDNHGPRLANLPPILLLPGITGIGTMHNLYALPFLRCNMVDYFTQRGHRCFVLTPRWGCDPTVAEEATIFDCRLDVAAAIKYIREKEALRPYVIGHCQGSVALCMGLLDGTIASSDLIGITANSVFMNQVFGYWNSLKGRTTLLIQLYELLAGHYFPIMSHAGSVLFQRLLDVLLRFYPVGLSRDRCKSTACHRTSFAFGLLWNHENLNTALHDNIHQFFAGTHTKLMKHVVGMGTRGICTDNASQSLLTEKNLQRLKGLPILFVSGMENQVFDPQSTLKDYELLRRRFGERLYRRFLAEGYGHLDPIVGKCAAEDVYWRIFGHLQGCIEEGGSSEELSRELIVKSEE